MKRRVWVEKKLRNDIPKGLIRRVWTAKTILNNRNKKNKIIVVEFKSFIC